MGAEEDANVQKTVNEKDAKVDAKVQKTVHENVAEKDVVQKTVDEKVKAKPARRRDPEGKECPSQ